MIKEFFELQDKIFGNYAAYGVQDCTDKWWRFEEDYISHWKTKKDALNYDENERYGCEPTNGNPKYIQEREEYTFIYYDDGSGEQLLAIFDNKKRIHYD